MNNGLNYGLRVILLIVSATIIVAMSTILDTNTLDFQQDLELDEQVFLYSSMILLIVIYIYYIFITVKRMRQLNINLLWLILLLIHPGITLLGSIYLMMENVKPEEEI